MMGIDSPEKLAMLDKFAMEYPVTFGDQFNLTYKLNIKTLFIPAGKDLSKQCRVFFAYRSYTKDALIFSNLFSQMNKCIIDAGKKNGSLSQFYRDMKKCAVEREKRDIERRKQIAEFTNQSPAFLNRVMPR